MKARSVRLRKDLARSIRQGHPWIYRDALDASPALDDGEVVTIIARDGRALALGYWDRESPIALRVLTTDRRADVRGLVRERVAAALERRLQVIERNDTDAFRWIHGEADRLPGVHVDVYGDAATVRFDGAGARAFYEGLAPVLVEEAARRWGPIKAVLARRQRGRGGTDAPAVLFGALPAGEREVRENGLRFGVDLVHGQKGGLFLDQRENRARVRELAKGRRVLNLFGYTGGFSVYAAAGGAIETTTVDVAGAAIAAARGNFERNGLPLDRATFQVADAFEFLERAVRRGEDWDLVISDPPSFAPSRRAVPTALRAYRRLHRLCASVVAPGGLLCAASCSSHVRGPALIATLEAGAREAGRTFTVTEQRGAGADHPVVPEFPEGDYLKLIVARRD